MCGKFTKKRLHAYIQEILSCFSNVILSFISAAFNFQPIWAEATSVNVTHFESDFCVVRQEAQLPQRDRATRYVS